jgi:hypothetical protein
MLRLIKYQYLHPSIQMFVDPFLDYKMLVSAAA